MFDKIDTESVVDNVMNKIKYSIMSGELKAGDKLPTEVELIEQLGIGRNSVREAIKMLSALGVLEVRRGQGTYVVSEVKESFFNPLLFSLIIEPKSNADIYELRVMFDAMVLFNLIEKMTSEKFEQLNAFLDSVYQNYLEGYTDTDYYVKKDLEFHYMLMNFTENPLIIKIAEVIISLFPESMRRSISQTNGIMRSITNHRNIVKLLQQKNTSEIIQLVENTLAEWKEEWKSS